MEDNYPHWKHIDPYMIPPTYSIIGHSIGCGCGTEIDEIDNIPVTDDVKSDELELQCSSIIGYSVGANMTGFYIPELSTALDCGIPSDHTPHIICITHGHGDHCKNLYDAIVDTSTVRPIIFAPKEIHGQIREHIRAQFALSTQNSKPKVLNKITITPVDTKNRYPVTIKGRPWIMDIIWCYHTVPTVGYGFSECRTRLKPKYSHLEKTRFNKLKQDLRKLYDLKGDNVDNLDDIDFKNELEKEYNVTIGIDDLNLDSRGNVRIDEDYEKPILCYLGDTSPRVFENKILDKFPIIFVECTFLDDTKELLEKAHKTRHIHWKYLKPIILARPDQTFVLFHFSALYKSKDIRKFFKNFTNPNHSDYIPNIKPWVKQAPTSTSSTSTSSTQVNSLSDAKNEIHEKIISDNTKCETKHNSYSLNSILHVMSNLVLICGMIAVIFITIYCMEYITELSNAIKRPQTNTDLPDIY